MTTTVRIKTASELAGTIPYLFGFTPDEGSLVYLSVGTGPIARVDMARDVRDTLAALQPMWDQFPPERAVLVLYTDDEPRAMLHASGFVGEVQRRGGQLVTAIRVHDGVCQHLFGNDTTLHPVDGAPAAAAPLVAAGRSLVATREESVARLSTDDNHIKQAPFEAALETLKAQGKPGFHQAAQHVIATMHQHREDGTLPSDDVIPTLVLALQHLPVRDLAWHELTRHHTDQDIEFFLHLYRRSPVVMTAPLACLLAFAAWLDGWQSPLARAGVDKALEVEPGYTMAHIIREALDACLDPGVYESSDTVAETCWAALR